MDSTVKGLRMNSDSLTLNLIEESSSIDTVAGITPNGVDISMSYIPDGLEYRLAKSKILGTPLLLSIVLFIVFSNMPYNNI